MLVRYKKKFVHDLRKTVEITPAGEECIDLITRNLECLMLTEQRHNIPACIELHKVMAQLPDPLEKAFFLSLYNQSKYFDLPVLMNSLRWSRDEMNILNVFSNLDTNPYGTSRESYIESFFNASLYGHFDQRIIFEEEWPKDDINALIMLFVVKMKMGKFEDSLMIYHYLIGRKDLTLNQWFTVKINRIQLFTKCGDLDGGLKLADDIISSVDDKVMQAYAKVWKADILFFMGRREECMDLMKSAISAFTTYGLPLFLAISYNARGVKYFIMHDHQAAERDWIKARKNAREAKSEFAEAKVLPNLADIALMAGKYDLAKSYLDKASEIFLKSSDYEGISVIEFNLALLSLEKGDLEGVRKHFKRCKEVAFPLPPKYMLDIFKEDMIKRANEKGIADIDKLL